ncbi:MAG: DUF1045 domain-containing protein [Bradyrhizobium sp.]|uniref:DUF1045 domain-containing protein n=1 Tax=Bradyrhizobium sp. TaxID=376 RepID=UPI0025C40734|nr:DUF1045 domain-containing protein [Bradyrhizobium sp.]MBI5260423.1 DUF1045 domain-containing protein [Bradyrhizobium sp.]
MSAFPRYAIYYAPRPASDLWLFGSTLLGYDAYTASSAPFPADALQTAPDWRELSADPRKYGFHATLKAPLSLADGKTEAELVAACAAFAAKARPIPVIRPIVDAISGFLAVIPAGISTPLQQLAADCVRDFDAFRGPLTAADRERRSPELLTARQREYLDRWGYPYVMEEFRFHMTLTGRLDEARRGQVLEMLRTQLAQLRLEALPIDRIALFRQDASDSRFGIIGSWQLQSH